jgi:hypothetical protein
LLSIFYNKYLYADLHNFIKTTTVMTMMRRRLFGKTRTHFEFLQWIYQDEGMVEALRYDWSEFRNRVSAQYPRSPNPAALKAMHNRFDGNKLTKKELYDNYVGKIRDGSLCIDDIEQTARKIAQYWGFSETPIEEALPTGRRVLYDRLCNQIKEAGQRGAIGGTWNQRHARRMAEEYGFPLAPLEEAIAAIDYEAQARTHLAFGQLGFRAHTAEAEKLAEEHGFEIPKDT